MSIHGDTYSAAELCGLAAYCLGPVVISAFFWGVGAMVARGASARRKRSEALAEDLAIDVRVLLEKGDVERARSVVGSSSTVFARGLATVLSGAPSSWKEGAREVVSPWRKRPASEGQNAEIVLLLTSLLAIVAAILSGLCIHALYWAYGHASDREVAAMVGWTVVCPLPAAWSCARRWRRSAKDRRALSTLYATKLEELVPLGPPS